VRRVLTVNVEGAAGTPDAFAVEVLEAATGRSIPGFAAADGVPLPADGLAVPMAWKGGQTLPTGQAIRLRFHLRGKGVRLYSFGFGSASL
jgi:hypothetical protein